MLEVVSNLLQFFSNNFKQAVRTHLINTLWTDLLQLVCSLAFLKKCDSLTRFEGTIFGCEDQQAAAIFESSDQTYERPNDEVFILY